MSRRLSIILGSHQHIPYGAGDEEYEQLYAGQIKPFISTLNQYPKIPAALHYSGPLLTWLVNNHPEIVILLREMAARKQLEFLGGGFYEPMTALLSQTDKIGQIEMLTTYIRKNFGKRPQGCWIPSLAWEQSLVNILCNCGMNYTFLDEACFAAAGIPREDFYMPRISENQGKIITVFPLFRSLSRDLAQKEPATVLEELLRHYPQDRTSLVTLFPDQLYSASGEPEELRWGRLFEAFSGIADQVVFTVPGKVYKNLECVRKSYFSGGWERNSLIIYPEANGIYAKMMFIHALINQLRGDKARKQSAREELWKAQGCSVFYPDGPAYGNICSNHLRKAVYKALLGAEKICREGSRFVPSLTAFDFDLDGRDEYLFQERNINCYVKTEGAGVFELDYLPKIWNYLDTLVERAPSGMDGEGRRRAAFLDRLIPQDLSGVDVEAGHFPGGWFCIAAEYESVSVDRARLEACFRLAPREAGVPFGQIEIEKQYRLSKDTLTVAYTLVNRGTAAETFMLLPQIDLSFAGDTSASLQRITVVRGPAREDLDAELRDCTDVDEIELRDRKNGVTINFVSDSPFAFWIFPIRASCRKGGEIQKQYQSTCIIPRRPVSLSSGEAYKTRFSLRLHQ
jgi:hypothetical protein